MHRSSGLQRLTVALVFGGAAVALLVAVGPVPRADAAPPECTWEWGGAVEISPAPCPSPVVVVVSPDPSPSAVPVTVTGWDDYTLLITVAASIVILLAAAHVVGSWSIRRG